MSYKNSIAAFFMINYLIIKKIRKVDHVALNLNERELYLIAPIIAIFCKLFKVKYSVRVFGGNFDKLYCSSFPIKTILKFVINSSSVFFLQTRRLVSEFSHFNNVVHLPTCRYVNNIEPIKKNKNFKNRFVFIGQIKKEKGIDIILEAFSNCLSASIDLFGPLEDEYTANILNRDNVRYKGILLNDKVIGTIQKYDYLVFPTIHSGEGYPGVIIESYAAGTPVISTDWMSIPEIVEHGKTGFLIEPNNTEALVKVLSTIDERRYENMRILAKDKFDEFDCNQVYGFYLKNLVRDS